MLFQIISSLTGFLLLPIHPSVSAPILVTYPPHSPSFVKKNLVQNFLHSPINFSVLSESDKPLPVIGNEKYTQKLSNKLLNCETQSSHRSVAEDSNLLEQSFSKGDT
jgi:hypothetical protein